MYGLNESLLWILVLLPLIVILLAGGLYLLIRYWQGATKTGLKQIRTELRSLQTQVDETRSELNTYSVDDPEPYGSQVVSILREIEFVEDKLKELYNDYVGIHENIHRISWENLKSAVRMPYHWYFLHQEAGRLDLACEEMEQKIDQSLDSIQSMNHQAWDTAKRARQSMQNIQAAMRILGDLRAANLVDSNLDQTFLETQNWEQRLNNEVPMYFISADETTVLEKTDKNTVASVHSILDEAEPAMNNILERAQNWTKQFKVLDVSLTEITAGYRALAEEFGVLESAEEFPVTWDKSRDQLAGLRNQIESLGSMKKNRNLDQVGKDLAVASRALGRLQELALVYENISQQRQELGEILKNPDLQHGEAWGVKAQKTASLAEKYDPENWPKADGANRIKEELDNLMEHQRKVPVNEISSPLNESEIPLLLENGRELLKLHKELRPRVASIQTRLAALQETERNIKDQVNRTRALLNQATSLSGSNIYLTEYMGDDVEKLREELEDIAEDLDHPEEGQVDKKAQRVNALVRKVDQSGQKWLDKFMVELDTKKEVLAKKVGLLNKIAALDDPAIEEAIGLIGDMPASPEPAKSKLIRGLPFTNGRSDRKSRPRIQLPFPEVVKTLKHRNDDWQRCIAVTRAIEDLEGPVLERYTRAEEQAELTREQLEKAMTIIPENRAWPPTTQFISNEKRAYAALEKKWEGLRTEPIRAIQLVSKLGELAEEYRQLEVKVGDILERAEMEQHRVLELERRLAESSMLWQYQMQAYGGNLYTKEDIQALLDEAEQEIDAIRKGYLRGSVPYNQVLHGLRGLCQHLESSLAAVDDQQSIDINGVVQQRYSR
jgi:hypothetical protein